MIWVPIDRIVVDAKEFHRRLDEFYEAGDIPGAYRFLHEQEDIALQRGDAAMSLTVSNALIGHCRENCVFEELEGHYLEALRCLDVLELRGTLEEATTLLNAATGFCVMGRIEESEDLFRSAEALYLALLPPDDLRGEENVGQAGVVFLRLRVDVLQFPRCGLRRFGIRIGIGKEFREAFGRPADVRKVVGGKGNGGRIGVRRFGRRRRTGIFAAVRGFLPAASVQD